MCAWTIVAGSWDRSSRWMQLDDRCEKLGSVESLNAAGWPLRAAEVGWVVGCSWTIVAGSWGRPSRWMWLDDHCGKLRSVVVGKSMSQFWQYVGLTEGVSIWLLARTASCTWARCCNARAVRNSESLRGLDAALLERRGRSRCWQFGPVESSELVTKTEPCLSTTGQVNGRGNRG